jgi:hypothetical protein
MEHPTRRFTRAAVGLVELWMVLLTLWVTLVGILASAFLLPFAPLVWGVLLLHWLLLGRVFDHRRWAYIAAGLYGWVFLYEPFVHRTAGSWNVWGGTMVSSLGGLHGTGGMLLLWTITTSVAVCWWELKKGW